MKPLAEWRRLTEVASEFRRQNEKAITAELHAETNKRITHILPLMLDAGLMVWCRNGQVSHMAVPCRSTACQFKGSKDLVVIGCLNCKRFTVTAESPSWARAEHVNWRTWSPEEKDRCRS